MTAATLRYRLARLINREVFDYLHMESEFEPHIKTLHLDDEVRITFSYPQVAKLPSYVVTIKEVRE